jgi:amidohydrolase
VTDLSAELLGRVRGWRHHLHAHPETGTEVPATAAFLAQTCEDLGWKVTPGIGGHGLVASRSWRTSPRAIALRADMDALPITERTGVPHASRTNGAMHACGHDGHMAMALGVAAALGEVGEGLDGTVHLLFQPAEEPGLGAAAMLEDGLFDRFPVEAVHGIHNLPGAPAGHLLTRTGPIMAAEDDFEVRITGRGGHASVPHLLVDPLVVAAQVVLALQTVISRSTDPLHDAVLSCTELVTDGARNAVPSHVTIRGDVRTFTPADSALVERRVREISAGVASAHGAQVEVDYSREFRPTVNHREEVARAVAAATAAVGADRVDGECAPIMASEDFGRFTEHVPGCFTFLGTGTTPAEGGVPLHSHDYDFNDDVLATGVAFHLELVTGFLR